MQDLLPKTKYKSSGSEPLSLIVTFLVLVAAFGTWFFWNPVYRVIATLDTPQIISFQGKITDDNRITVDDGNYSMRFAIYDAASGGSCLWSGGNTDANTGTIDCTGDTPDGTVTVAVVDGVFSVLLGDTGQNALPDALFDDNSTLFLGVTVGGDAEMSPRIRLGSAPYALQAGDADLFDSLDSAAFLRSQVSDTFEGAAGQTLTVQSSLTGGARSVEVLNISQANDGTNNFTGSLFSIDQLDIASVGTAMEINQDGIGTALAIDQNFTTNASGYSFTVSRTDSSESTADSNGIVYFSNENDGSSTGSPDSILVIQQGDADENVGAGIQFNVAGGGMTYAVNASDADILRAFYAGNNEFQYDTLRFDETTSGTLAVSDFTQNLLTITDDGTTGTLFVNGRIEADTHLANQGLRLPTNAGAPSGVTGTEEGDIVWDSSGDELYVYDGTAFTSISGGSGTTLQDAYDAGNTITSTDARNIAFSLADTTTDSAFIVNLNCVTCSGGTADGDFVITDAGTGFFAFRDDKSLDYISDQTTTDAFDFTIDSLTTANGIDLSADALTTGRAFLLSTTAPLSGAGALMQLSQSVSSSSPNIAGTLLSITRDSNTTSGSTTGDLVVISNTDTGGNVTNSASLLYLDENDTAGAGIDAPVLSIDNSGDGPAIGILHDGGALDSSHRGVISVESNATQAGLFIDQNGNTSTNPGVLTGGALHLDNTGNTADGITVYSNQSAASGGANLLNLRADHASFAGDVVLIENDGIGSAILIDQAGNSGTTVNASNGGALHIQNSNNNNYGLTVYSSEDAAAASPLAMFFADATTFDQDVLVLRQDGTAAALAIDQNTATATGLRIDTVQTTGRAIEINSTSTTTGSGIWVNQDENTAMLTFADNSSSNDEVSFYVGDAIPTFTAEGGSLFVLHDNIGSGTPALYFNTSSTDTGTTWSLISAGSGTVTLDTAYTNGQTIDVDSAGNLTFNLTSTQDFILQDASSDYFIFHDDRSIEYTSAGSIVPWTMDLDSVTTGTGIDIALNGLTSGIGMAMTTDGLTGGSLLDLNVTAGGGGGEAINIEFDDGEGSAIYIEGSATGGRGIQIVNSAYTSGTGLEIQQPENTSFLSLFDDTNSDQVSFYTGDAAPSFSAEGGSLFVLHDDTGTVAPALYLNTSATDTGTTWTQVSTGSGTTTLDDAYTNGQTITVDAAGNLVFNLSTTTDFIIQDAGTAFFTFADTGSLTYAGIHNRAFAMTSDLTSGARTADLMTLTQVSDATFDSTGDLLAIATSDVDSTGDGINIVHGGAGNAIDISTSLNSTNADAPLVSLSQTGSSFDQSFIFLDIATNNTSASGIYIDNNGNAATDILIESQNNRTDIVHISQNRTTDGISNWDDDILSVTRDNNVTSSFALSGPVAYLADNSAGSYTSHTGSVLDIEQNYASSTGNVVDISSVGDGAIINIDVDNGDNNDDLFILTTDEVSDSGTAADTVKARLTASGEWISDVGFTAGGASTSYYDGSITSSAGMAISASGASSFTTNSGTLAFVNTATGNGISISSLRESGDGLSLNALGTGGNIRFTSNGAIYFNDENIGAPIPLSLADTALDASLTQGVIDAINDLEDEIDALGTPNCVDCLDFDDFADSMTLDNNTTFSLGSQFFNVNLNGTGDFTVRDAGTAFWTMDSSRTTSYVLDTATADGLQIDATVLTTGNALRIQGDNSLAGGGTLIKLDYNDTVGNGDVMVVETSQGTFTNGNSFRLGADGGITIDTPKTSSGLGVISVDADDITISSLLTLNSASANRTSGDMVYVESDPTYTTGTTAVSGSLGEFIYNLSIESGATVTPSGSLFSVTRDADVNTGATYTNTASVMTLSSNISDISGTETDSGFILDIDQFSSSATGNVIDVDNNGTGMGLFINQDNNTTATFASMNAVDGGALHIDNTSNIRMGLSVFTSQDSSQGTPLVGFKNSNITFDTSILRIDQIGTGDGIEVNVSGGGTGLRVVNTSAADTVVISHGASQSSSDDALFINQDSLGSSAIYIDSENISNPTVRIDATEVTTGNGILLEVDSSLTTGEGFKIDYEGSSADTVFEVESDVNSDDTPIFLIFGDGSVGINGGIGSEELDVEGQIQFNLDGGAGDTTIGVCKNTSDSAGVQSGTEFRDCTTTPSDVAEFYETDGAVSAGDIVAPNGATFAYDSDAVNALTGQVVGTESHTIAVLEKSSGAYQANALGVVSTSPAQTYGRGVVDSGALHPEPIAVTGRVPVKVDVENGTISAGDPITTSSTAGVGMKSTLPGKIVGYALDDWAGPGQGTILVYVAPGFHMGSAMANDGTIGTFTGSFAFAATGTADSGTTGYDSYGLSLRGSGWDGADAQAVSMTLVNQVTDADDYRLSIRNTADTEVAYLTDDGAMMVAGDMQVGGKIYPSDQGALQNDFYIYFDSTLGAGMEYMRTNAAGWSTGSYDFAEMFPSSQALEAGDVVVFDTISEHVKRTSTPYDQKIAGIVSTRPGFLAGEARLGDFPIALAGRVPTKVTLEGGAIAVGDPLTTSSSAGYAMKATQAGPIIGYALEPYTGSGDSMIIVYVNASYYGGAPGSSAPGTQNAASGFGGGSGSNLTSLNMEGTIYMHGNKILSIGLLEGLGKKWRVDSEGKFATSGSYDVAIKSFQGEDVLTHATLAMEHKITLSGTGTLNNGFAHIEFEQVAPEFNDVISTIADIRVMITLRGPANGAYVEDADHNGFDVIETMGGSSDAAFDWFVEAYRKDYEPEEELEIDQPPEEESVEENVEETPEEEIVTEDLPAEEPSIEEPPVDVPLAEEPSTEEPPNSEPPAEEEPSAPPQEESPVESPPVEEPTP